MHKQPKKSGCCGPSDRELAQAVETIIRVARLHRGDDRAAQLLAKICELTSNFSENGLDVVGSSQKSRVHAQELKWVPVFYRLLPLMEHYLSGRMSAAEVESKMLREYGIDLKEKVQHALTTEGPVHATEVVLGKVTGRGSRVIREAVGLYERAADALGRHDRGLLKEHAASRQRRRLSPEAAATPKPGLPSDELAEHEAVWLAVEQHASGSESARSTRLESDVEALVILVEFYAAQCPDGDEVLAQGIASFLTGRPDVRVRITQRARGLSARDAASLDRLRACGL